MDTEAETVATEGPARPLNCLEAEAAAGAAAEDSCAARGSLQPVTPKKHSLLSSPSPSSYPSQIGRASCRERVSSPV